MKQMNNNKASQWLLKCAKMVALPVIVYGVLFVVCRIAGHFGVANAARFGVGTNMTSMLRTALTTGCIALAISYNLTSGRFDFSVGATMLLAVILGGMLTKTMNLSGFGGALFLLMISIFFGIILGAINGLLYITLRLPPMICSLGVCMLYEALGFVVSNAEGVSFLGRNDLLVWAFSPYIYIMMFFILAILYILLNLTSFGFNTRSLRSGQEIAVNVGVGEKRNAVLCYAVAGGLLAVAGVLNMSVLGKTTPKIGLGSISYVQNAFLPMFIGNILEKHGDRNTGVVMGAIVQAEITAAFAALGLSTSVQSILSGLIVICFFAYSGNAYRLVEVKMFREKKEKALAELEGNK